MIQALSASISAGESFSPGMSSVVISNQDRRSGQEMIERFLFDRVDAKSRRAAIGREHHLIALPRTHEAKAALAFVQLATPRAEIALDAPVRQRMPIAARFAQNGLIHLAAGLIV
jgi:hypothetical protein